MKSVAVLLFAALACAIVSPFEASAQWRSTAWTMDLKNDTDHCIALTVGEEGSPPIDAAMVWAHRDQHFDDNHTSVVIHAKVFEGADCTGRFVADLREPMHQLRNIMTVTQTGSAFTMRRRETPDAEVTSAGITRASDDENGENFQVGPSHQMQTSAVAGIRLGDSAEAVAAIARTMPHRAIAKTTIAFTTAGGASVIARLRARAPKKPMTVWSVTSQASTPSARAAATFARTALALYGSQPTTQVSGPFIRLHYCVLEKGALAMARRAACSHNAARLEVYAAIPVSRIELQ